MGHKIGSIKNFVAQITAPDANCLRHDTGILLGNQIVICCMIPSSGGIDSQQLKDSYSHIPLSPCILPQIGVSMHCGFDINLKRQKPTHRLKLTDSY